LVCASDKRTQLRAAKVASTRHFIGAHVLSQRPQVEHQRGHVAHLAHVLRAQGARA
jgi:hypothetical protein